MVFLWFSYGFPMVFLWLDVVSQWFILMIDMEPMTPGGVIVGWEDCSSCSHGIPSGKLTKKL